MSWAAHEFENYFIQRHVGIKVSFLAIVLGTQTPDLFTKIFVYGADDPAYFHRAWPGVGFSHSLTFGFVLAVLVLAVTKSRAWGLGLLIGNWAHVLTDVADTAGVMPFFPFSTEPVTISMWKHAAVEGRYGDAAAYYSSLGGVWDLAWLVVLLVFARKVLRADYFRSTIVPADPRAWAWIRRRFRLTERGLLLVYQGLFFYGLGRMISWFLYARFDARTPFEPMWRGPSFVEANDLSDAGWVEVLVRTSIGGLLFAATLVLCWKLFVRRLWLRAEDVPIVQRGTGIDAILERHPRRRTHGSGDGEPGAPTGLVLPAGAATGGDLPLGDDEHPTGRGPSGVGDPGPDDPHSTTG